MIYYLFPFYFEQIKFPDTFKLLPAPPNPSVIWVPAIVTILATIIGASVSAYMAYRAMNQSTNTAMATLNERLEFDKEQAAEKAKTDKEARDQAERLTKQSAKNKRKSEYYLQRKEYLAIVIGSLLECEAYYEQARQTHNEMSKQGLLLPVTNPADTDARTALRARYVEYIAKGSDILLKASIASEQYGKLPSDFGFKNELLSSYVNSVGYTKLRGLYGFIANADTYEDIGRHLDMFVDDMRNLMITEEELAQSATTGLAHTVVSSGFPYLVQMDSKLVKAKYDISELNWDDI